MQLISMNACSHLVIHKANILNTVSKQTFIFMQIVHQLLANSSSFPQNIVFISGIIFASVYNSDQLVGVCTWVDITQEIQFSLKQQEICSHLLRYATVITK